jgi:hypothetical protein
MKNMKSRFKSVIAAFLICTLFLAFGVGTAFAAESKTVDETIREHATYVHRSITPMLKCGVTISCLFSRPLTNRTHWHGSPFYQRVKCFILGMAEILTLYSMMWTG